MLKLPKFLQNIGKRTAGHASCDAAAGPSILRDSSASVALITALSVVGVIGFGALALDVNRALDERVRNQMVADSAALSSAMAYSAAGRSASVLNPTAQDIAVANGLATSTTTATTVSNYPTTGNSAVQATVTTTVPFSLAAILNSGSAFTITATAYAHLPSTTAGAISPCFLALSSGVKAIETSGAAVISASTCDVAAVGGVYNSGTSISAATLASGSSSVTNDSSSQIASATLINYSTTWTSPVWNTNVPAAANITQKTTTLGDGLASNSDIIAARTLLGTYTAPTAPSNPSSAACSGASAGSYSTNQTFATGTYNYSTLSITGGTVTYGAGSTINVCSGLTFSGSSVNFGNSNLNVNGGVVTSGSGSFTVGNGNVYIGTTSGTGVVKFNASSHSFGTGIISINGHLEINGATSITMGAGAHSFVSICGLGTSCGGGYSLNAGAGDVNVTTGIYVTGSSTVAFGAGNYAFGKIASSGNCITLSGSGNLFMGDGTFSCNGNIDTAGGGSKIVFGATTNHYINGNFKIYGAALFGAGAYIINGNIDAETGGTVWPYTSPVTGLTYGSGSTQSGYGMSGTGVTFIMAGTVTLAGANATYLKAPTTTTSGGAIADILMDSQTAVATSWGAGSNSNLYGVAHLPNSTVTMSGGNSTTSGGCFMLTANIIKVTGGAVTASACGTVSTLGSSSSESSTAITLVG